MTKPLLTLGDTTLLFLSASVGCRQPEKNSLGFTDARVVKEVFQTQRDEGRQSAEYHGPDLV